MTKRSSQTRIDKSDDRAIHEPTAESGTGGSGRRYRISAPRLAIPLPPYDVRVRRELAHRRALLAMARRLGRVATLHGLDIVAALAAGRGAMALLDLGGLGSMLPVMVGLMILGLEARGAYQAAHGRRDPWRIASGVAVGSVGLALLSVVAPAFELPMTLVALYSVFALVAILAERALVDTAVRMVYAHGVGLRRAVIVGKASDVEMIMTGVRDDSQQDHLVVGYVVPGPFADAGALGTLVELESIIQKEEPAELILGTPLAAEVYRRIADICVRHGVSLLAVPVWPRRAGGWAEPTRIGSLTALWLHPVRLEVPSLVLKRSMDIVLGFVLLVLCLPLLALIALAIKIDSRGPVFFRQRRVGLGGREFVMWKFRSMRHLAERRHDDVAHLNHYADARLFKLRDDPRITSVGRFLRRFSLDELPQLFNVLAGDMSLVGPRPPLPQEVMRYEPRHYIRLTVVPGMTGPWQVGGRNLITDFEEVVRLEREYVERWSFRLDLKIMAKTFGVMLSGRGAY